MDKRGVLEISMTPHQRLIRVFQRKEVDRLPIRIRGVDPLFPREDWRILYDLVEKCELEINKKLVSCRIGVSFSVL